MSPRHAAVQRARRVRGDEGAGLVEFAFVGILLLLLVFGIIQFGLILSFKQDLTRAAAEGARAGAVALPSGVTGHNDPRRLAADTATNEAVEAIGGRFDNTGCATDGITCDVPDLHQCLDDPGHECVTVQLVYKYGDHPLYGRVPLISEFLPNEIRAESVARVNE